MKKTWEATLSHHSIFLGGLIAIFILCIQNNKVDPFSFIKEATLKTATRALFLQGVI